MMKKIDINKIVVVDRIRKELGNIEELAQDIEENGLINPPVVTPEYVLIAGERRLLAAKHLGWGQIEVHIVAVRDYEHQLKIEISENENRKEFTFSERMDYARRLERVEKEKARQRMLTGAPATDTPAGGQCDLGEGEGVGGETRHSDGDSSSIPSVDPRFPGTQGAPADSTAEKGKTAEIVAKKSGFGSYTTYVRAKYIDENADNETIEALNQRKISIKRAFIETKASKMAKEEAARLVAATLVATGATLAEADATVKQEKIKAQQEVLFERGIAQQAERKLDHAKRVEEKHQRQQKHIDDLHAKVARLEKNDQNYGQEKAQLEAEIKKAKAEAEEYKKEVLDLRDSEAFNRGGMEFAGLVAQIAAYVDLANDCTTLKNEAYKIYATNIAIGLNALQSIYERMETLRSVVVEQIDFPRHQLSSKNSSDQTA